MIKSVGNEISFPLSHILNLSLTNGVFPSQLKNCRVIPIEHIRQVKGQMVTFPDLTATLKSAGSFKKQGTEAYQIFNETLD